MVLLSVSISPSLRRDSLRQLVQTLSLSLFLEPCRPAKRAGPRVCSRVGHTAGNIEKSIRVQVWKYGTVHAPCVWQAQGSKQQAGRRMSTQRTRLQEATSARAKDVTSETPTECLPYGTVHAQTKHTRGRAHQDNRHAGTTQHARRRRGTRKRRGGSIHCPAER